MAPIRNNLSLAKDKFMTDNLLEMEIGRPLGPLLAKFTLSDRLIEYLNEKLQSVGEDLADYSDNLVGKVSGELKFTDDMTRAVLEEIQPYIVKYHLTYFPQDKRFESLNVSCTAAWFVRQFNGEYNPIHVHNGCTISCVGYLALPEGIEKEFEEDGNDHHPANGQIEFAYGTSAAAYTSGTLRKVPKVGDFYVFPNGLWHTVYPFTTIGERRSFSMNITVTLPEGVK